MKTVERKESEIYAEVAVTIRGPIPLNWARIEVPSILEQILQRGAEHSVELEGAEIKVKQQGVMTVSIRGVER